MKKLIATGLISALLLLPHVATAASPLLLHSPNGGEKFKAGANMNISWSDSFPDDANVSGTLYKLRGSEWTPRFGYGDQIENSYPLNFPIQTNSGKATVQIPVEAIPGNYVLSLDFNYSSDLSNLYGSVFSAKPFKIEGVSVSTNAPKIATIAPNPVYTGDSAVITGAGFKSDSKVTLHPIGGEYYVNYEAIVTKQTKNSITFKLDQYVPAGNYEVRVAGSSGTSEPTSLVVATNPVNPYPFITSVAPTVGLAGTLITISGGNFTPEENSVNYYSNEYIPYPIEDGPGDSEDEEKDMHDDKSIGYGPPDDGSGTYPANGIITGIKSPDGKTLQFTLPEKTVPGIYNITVSNSRGYSDEGYFTLINPDPAAVHPSGANVQAPNGTIYFVANGTRTPYPSAAVFVSYKFNSWANVLPASSGDMTLPVAKYYPIGSSQETDYIQPPRSGSLVKDNGIVYIISGDHRIPFTSAKAFTSAGYSFSNVIDANTSFLVTLMPAATDSAHPNGTAINDNGTIYVITNGYRVGIPSMSILESWGYSASEIVPANVSDLKAPISSVASKRPPGQLILY